MATLHDIRSERHHPWYIDPNPCDSGKGDVPLIREPPSLSDYDLKAEDVERIKLEFTTAKEQELRKGERNAKSSIAGLVLTFLFGFVATTVSTGSIVAGGFAGFFFVVFVFTISLPLLLIVSAIKGRFQSTARESPEVTRLREYSKDLGYFRYWERRLEREFWESLSGLEFENEIARAFRLNGYSAKVTATVADEGIDIVLIKAGVRIAVQCKHLASRVGQPALRDFWGSIDHFDGGGIFVGSSGFTGPAKAFAEEKGIVLFDLSDILEMGRTNDSGNVKLTAPESAPESEERPLGNSSQQRKRMDEEEFQILRFDPDDWSVRESLLASCRLIFETRELEDFERWQLNRVIEMLERLPKHEQEDFANLSLSRDYGEFQGVATLSLVIDDQGFKLETSEIIRGDMGSDYNSNEVLLVTPDRRHDYYSYDLYEWLSLFRRNCEDEEIEMTIELCPEDEADRFSASPVSKSEWYELVEGAPSM